jgi:high-affinity Fe2+/Pb2+ permease
MTAITVETAKTVGLVVAGALVLLAIGSAWVIKSVVSKVLTIAILGGLAIGVWTQRSNAADCADKAKERLRAGDTSSITCTFVGTDIEIGK